MSDVQLFSTSECTRCTKLSTFFEKNGIKYMKRVIDKDPEARTDALMLKIMSAPAIVVDEKVLKTKEIFDGEKINENKVLLFVNEG